MIKGIKRLFSKKRNRAIRPVMKVKRLHPDAVIPAYAHEGDSGLDLYTVEDVIISAKGTKVVPTGIAVVLPPNTELQVRNRSGVTVKGCTCRVQRVQIGKKRTFVHELQDKLCYERVILGTVDNPYRGEVGIMVYNEENEEVVIPKGTKLAQAVVCPVVIVDIEETDELSETTRGEGGYGSTDKISTNAITIDKISTNTITI